MLNSHSLSIYEVPTMCWALLHAKDSEVNKTDQTPCPHGAQAMIYTIAAAAAAKSLQSCPTLCDPIDGSPPGSPVPGILQARTLEWVAISFSSA